MFISREKVWAAGDNGSPGSESRSADRLHDVAFQPNFVAAHDKDGFVAAQLRPARDQQRAGVDLR
ncbi:MAG: hypothetical protein EXS31_03740 [Pedosphaera sp.]|nr:hypothetical protein [Pedosphaera sp.]